MRRRRPVLIAALACALGLSLLGGAPARSAPEGFPGDAAEQEAYDLFNQEKLLTARTRADALLRVAPDSAVGHYVLGSVLREAEGSLARAMSHLKESRRLFEARHGTRGLPEPTMRLHREILIGLEYTAGLMEQYEYELSLLDDHDALYEPELLGQHAWPLMKLHRYDEARAFAKRAIDSGSPWQKNLGLNALCAIEAEAHERKASRENCMAALEHAKQRAAQAIARGSKQVPNVAVHAYNAGLGALSVLRYDEAERLALEGTHRLERTASNPFRFLVHLYLGAGRSGDAVAAIREMQRWCAHQPPGSRDQKAAETDATVATLLLVAGEATAGLRFISRAIERPDRQGISSAQPEQALGGHAVIRRALRVLDAELEAEEASTRAPIGRVKGMFASLGARASAFPDEERVINVLSEGDRLESTLRVNLDGGLDDLPTWLTGDLVAILGPGVVEVALARARADEPMLEVGPFFDAVEAELRLTRGDDARALDLAESALERLPPAEALLRARVAAIGAEAARRRGDKARTVALFQRALELDPGVVRRLGLAIPARVVLESGGEALEHAATLLRRSPRLRGADGGFELRLGVGAPGPGGPGLRACLQGQLGASLGCAEIEAKADELPSERGARLARELHHVVFAIHLPLTDSDLRSLDGTTTMAHDASRERLRDLLDDRPEAPEP